MVRHLIVSGAAHPLRLRSALVTDPRGQSSAASPVLKFQIPRYEHVVTRDDAALVGHYLRTWSGPAWAASDDFDDYERKCRDALQIPQASFCALEAYRWAFRSALRLHGYRFVKLLQEPITAPTLQLHGSVDPAVLPRTAQGSGRYVAARYEWRLIDGAGHFPHVEKPDEVTGAILEWLKG
jgi:pimeloyl-ACP methyl ester carboxylesterase